MININYLNPPNRGVFHVLSYHQRIYSYRIVSFHYLPTLVSSIKKHLLSPTKPRIRKSFRKFSLELIRNVMYICSIK